MFPKSLDGAEVLYHSQKAEFGTVKETTEKILDYISYLAICKYADTSGEYYLFDVNENYEVIGDTVFESTETCMRIADASYSSNIIWQKI